MAGHSSGSSVGLCGSRAPPPTPSQGGGHSAIVNNDAFSAFLETSLRFSGLVLPDTPVVKGVCKDFEVPLVDWCGDDVARHFAEAASEFGCFQVVGHGLDQDLAARAEGECCKMFELRSEDDEEMILMNYKDPDTADDVLSGKPSSELRDYAVNMEQLACKIIQNLLEGLGSWDFTSFFTDVQENSASVLCLCSQKGHSKSSSPPRLRHSYPYILSLQYQATSGSHQVFVDRSWSRITLQAGSILVTVGDVMKVWSNGKYKGVVGRAVAENCCTSVELLYCPSPESIINPITQVSEKTIAAYSSFVFKDYASRLMKQRILFKDPLERFKLFV